MAVFPCNKAKKPLTQHGHLDASMDLEAVATMFGEFPDSFVGVHAARSGLVVLDLDIRPETEKNGFESLELNYLGIDNSWGYATPSGGRHVWYKAPKGIDLPPQVNYRGLSGVDRKSGSSYIIAYATTIDNPIVLVPAPEWLCDVKPNRTTGDTFEGGTDEWLHNLDKGEPGERVLAAIERIPDGEFSHPELISRQFEFIRLAAEGATGVHSGLDLLREAWLRPPYDTEDYAWEFDSALHSGIKQFGAALARIESLPSYLDTLDLIGSSATDRLMGEPKQKRDYFRVVESLAHYNLTDAQVATLLWNGPATRALAREWGIDFLFAKIAEIRIRAHAPVENPAEGLDSGQTSQYALELLRPEERVATETQNCYVDTYLAWAKTKVNVLNEPYHRQNALTVMSLLFGGHVFVPLKARPMGVNIFQIGLGGSSTGKSESIAMRDQILKYHFAEDLEYNVGSNPSPEALHEVMLGRDFQTSFFNTDEAAAPLNEFLTKSYTAGMTDRLTSYYEGFVPPMLRRGNAGSGGNKKNSAITSFNISMFGTPDKVLGLLTRDQFESGFLARFIWGLSAAVVDDDSQYEEQQATEKEAVEEDQVALGLAEILGVSQGIFGDRHPMLATTETLRRLSQNRALMDKSAKDDEQYVILQPSIRRLGDSIRKIAVLIAIADGSSMVYPRHGLKAIEIAEELYHNMKIVASKVSSSEWQRNTDEVMQYIMEQGGDCSSARVYHRFRKFEFRDVQAFLQGLAAQGRIRIAEPSRDKGEWVSSNRRT